jgi:hypothetical protein
MTTQLHPQRGAMALPAILSLWWIAIGALKATAPAAVHVFGIDLSSDFARLIGVVEVAVGILIVFPRTRLPGLWLCLIGLIVSVMTQLSQADDGPGCGCLGRSIDLGKPAWSLITSLALIAHVVCLWGFHLVPSTCFQPHRNAST